MTRGQTVDGPLINLQESEVPKLPSLFTSLHFGSPDTNSLRESSFAFLVNFLCLIAIDELYSIAGSSTL